MHAPVRVDHFDSTLSAADISFPCDNAAMLRVIESSLERQYENIFSTVAQFRAVGLMHDVHALVLRKADYATTIFVFRIEKDKVVVMNEAVRVGQDDLRRAAAHIFEKFESVTVIRWHAIQTDLERLPFPFQRVNYSEDFVVTLPPTQQEYLARLGKATRKNLQRHRNRLQRDHPDIHFAGLAGAAIEERHIRQVVEFNRARMRGKHKGCGMAEKEVRRLLVLARTHGLVFIISIGDRICAGAICNRVGANYFMEISAHDPAYDSYRMGTLCCYLTICEAIARGGRELHLLWGRDEYKYLLLGQPRDLDDVIVYRSPVHVLANCGLVVRSGLQDLRRKVKLGLHAIAGRHASRLTKSGLDWLRAVMHFMEKRA